MEHICLRSNYVVEYQFSMNILNSRQKTSFKAPPSKVDLCEIASESRLHQICRSFQLLIMHRCLANSLSRIMTLAIPWFSGMTPAWEPKQAFLWKHFGKTFRKLWESSQEAHRRLSASSQEALRRLSEAICVSKALEQPWSDKLMPLWTKMQKFL